jgi:hypothetical protein
MIQVGRHARERNARDSVDLILAGRLGTVWDVRSVKLLPESSGTVRGGMDPEGTTHD